MGRPREARVHEDPTYPPPGRPETDPDAGRATGSPPPGPDGPWRPREGVRVLAGTLCVLALMMVVLKLLLVLDRSLGHPHGLRQASIPMAFFVVAAPFLAWTLRRPGPDRDWLRLGRPAPGSAGRLAGIAALGLVVTAAAALLCSLLPGFRNLMQDQAALAGWKTAPELARAVVLLAVLPALAEELYFRGYLLQRLGRCWGPRVGLLVQAAIFGAMHGPAAPVATVLGLTNGAMVLASGSLWPGMVLHFLNNLLVVAALKGS